MENCWLRQTKLDIPTVFFAKRLYLDGLCLEDPLLRYYRLLPEMIFARMAIPPSREAAHSSGDFAASLFVTGSGLLDHLII